MLTLLLFTSVPLAIIVVLIVRLSRRNRGRNDVTLREVGLVMDSALRSFAQDGVTLIALSAMLVPLGLSTGSSFLAVARLLGFGDGTRLGDGGDVGWTVVVWLGWLGMFGIGKTLLAYSVAQAMRLREAGQPVSVARIFAHMRWRAAGGLAFLLAIPSVLATVFGILGALVALSWSIAPFILVDERCSPYQAIKRSVQIVRPRFSGLLNIIALLWIIGWLLVSTPLFGLIFVLPLLLPVSSYVSEVLTLLTFVVGNVVVPPLLALGSFHYYRYVLAGMTLQREEDARLQTLINRQFGPQVQDIHLQ